MSAKANRYPNIIRAIQETAWAILPEKLATITELIRFRAEGGHLSHEEIQSRIGSGNNKSSYTAGAIAVIPISGVICPRANMITEYSGGTSLQQFSADLMDAANDDQVAAIVLDINSPGGSCSMLTETAALIRQVRELKPVIASANTLAASAAYHLGAQATELNMTPSGLVGSVGVISAHEDHSGEEELLGVKTTLITAGRYKAEGNPFEPLSDEARAQIQKGVDDYYGLMVSDIAKGRNVSTQKVINDFGQGRVLTSSDALAAGMVDRIEPTTTTLARVAAGQIKAGSNSKTKSLSEGERLANSALESPLDMAALEEWAASEKQVTPPTSADELEALELELDLFEKVAGKENI